MSLSKQRIKLRVWGDFACFTRPEMKVERVSYDVMTPSAARGFLEAIYWKPQIAWVIDRIHVLKPVRFTNLRRNEVEKKISVNSIKGAMKTNTGNLGIYVDEIRQQRASTLLKDVEYIIEAHFELRDTTESPEKHYEIFKRRAKRGQYFHHPYLGCREFSANFEWIQGEISQKAIQEDRQLGYMLHDIDFGNDMQPHFFRAELKQGVMEVPSFHGSEVKR